MKIIIGKIKNM